MTRNAARTDVKHRHRGSHEALPPASSALVLLVEPELASRLSSANELLDEGYDIVESEGASEAMNILRGRNDFDAMVTEIDEKHFPGGEALIRYAASHHPSMKILVSSDGTEALVKSSEIPASFPPRPFQIGGLARRLRGLLKQSTPAFPEALPVS